MTTTNQPNEKDADVIGVVAHELKTPVAAILGFLDLVQNAGELNDNQKKYLARAMQSLNRMQGLIASLQDWSRLAEGKPLELGLVDISAMIHEVVELLREVAAERGIVLHVNVAQVPKVLADERLLGHVFTNLVSNAIKYNRDQGEVWIDAAIQGADLRVSVRDTGIGIDAKDQARVFERFFRATRKRTEGRRIEGTGLGLAIVQTVVELHGGRVWLESVPGEGSTFFVTIPAQASSSRSLPRHYREHDSHASGEITDSVDDDLQERSENFDRERDDLGT